jgi:hypothetical protein
MLVKFDNKGSLKERTNCKSIKSTPDGLSLKNDNILFNRTENLENADLRLILDSKKIKIKFENEEEIESIKNEYIESIDKNYATLKHISLAQNDEYEIYVEFFGDYSVNLTGEIVEAHELKH